MKSLLTLSLLFVLGIAAAADVYGQSDRAAADDEVFRRLVEIQMVESLQSPLPMVRNQILKNAIVYSTIHRGRIDLSGVVATIAKVAESDQLDANRRLAIAALRTIDTYRSNQFLARLEGMQDTEYRDLIAGVLSEYRETQMSGTL